MLLGLSLEFGVFEFAQKCGTCFSVVQKGICCNMKELFVTFNLFLFAFDSGEKSVTLNQHVF